jgi:hypothetical protein
LAAGALRQLTNDHYADLHPVWSPDGHEIAFATDRYSTDLPSLVFGPCQLAVLDLSTGDVRPLVTIAGARAVNPQWAADGRSIYFLSDPDRRTNIYRVDLASGVVFQISHSLGGIAGLTATSPALSSAREVPALIFSVYRRGSYVLETRRGASNVSGEPVTNPAIGTFAGLPPIDRVEGELDRALKDGLDLTTADLSKVRSYPANLFLESIGQPYLSSGGGPFGTFIRGGGSLLLSDMLGQRKLGIAAQFGNRLRETGLGLQYLNRERRWNWGFVADLQPSIRALPHQRLVDRDGQAGVSLETNYFEQMQLHAGGLIAYPLNQTHRIEFGAGVRHIRYRQTLQSTVRSLENGRVLESTTATGAGGMPATLSEVSAAFVGDSALFGATSPILGSRYRFEVATSAGNLSFVRVLLDSRRYSMPLKPFTIATRMVHVGQYGRDADDPRLQPAFLGSREFVHGYGWNSLHCQPAIENDCNALEKLLGNRLIAGNLEVRFPIMGVLSREIRYKAVPADGFLFTDAGLVWSRSPLQTAGLGGRSLIGSVGGGVRINALGLPLEFAAVRALRPPAHGWSFDFSLRTGF